MSAKFRIAMARVSVFLANVHVLEGIKENFVRRSTVLIPIAQDMAFVLKMVSVFAKKDGQVRSPLLYNFRISNIKFLNFQIRTRLQHRRRSGYSLSS